MVVITAWGNSNLPDWGMITRKALEIRQAFGPMSDEELCQVMDYLESMVEMWSFYLFGKDDMDLSHIDLGLGIMTREQALDFVEGPELFGKPGEDYQIRFDRKYHQIFLSKAE